MGGKASRRIAQSNKKCLVTFSTSCDNLILGFPLISTSLYTQPKAGCLWHVTAKKPKMFYKLVFDRKKRNCFLRCLREACGKRRDKTKGFVQQVSKNLTCQDFGHRANLDHSIKILQTRSFVSKLDSKKIRVQYCSNLFIVRRLMGVGTRWLRR